MIREEAVREWENLKSKVDELHVNFMDYQLCFVITPSKFGPENH
jgi:hypothetical protein